jgi:hypothetical protein
MLKRQTLKIKSSSSGAFNTEIEYRGSKRLIPMLDSNKKQELLSSINMNKLIFILFGIVLIVNNSCLHRQFEEGRVEIKSIADTALKDSSLLYGHIYYVNWSGKQLYYEKEFEIWIENSDLKTTNDTTGFYSLKTKPGTFTIKCQSSGNTWEQLIEKTDVELSKNKKIEIDFYIGTTIE